MEFHQTANPCLGCEYYNQPYWSVMNPCKNCYHNRTSNGVDGYFITTTNTSNFDPTTDTITITPEGEYTFVRSGEWVHKDNCEVRCSICNALIGIGTNLDEVVENVNYCPNCGANMKKINYVPSKESEK